MAQTDKGGWFTAWAGKVVLLSDDMHSFSRNSSRWPVDVWFLCLTGFTLGAGQDQDGEEVRQGHHREVLHPSGQRLPHQQEGVWGGRHHPQQASAQQNCRVTIFLFSFLAYNEQTHTLLPAGLRLFGQFWAMFPCTLVGESPKYLEGEVKFEPQQGWWGAWIRLVICVCTGLHLLIKVTRNLKKKKRQIKFEASLWMKLAKITEIIFRLAFLLIGPYPVWYLLALTHWRVIVLRRSGCFGAFSRELLTLE